MAPSQMIGVNTSVPGIWPYVQFVGHAGADFGTYSHSGFHPTLGFSFSIMTNRNMGSWKEGQLPFCLTWRVLWKLLELPGGAAAFDCT